MSKRNDFIAELSKVSHLKESSEIKDYFDILSDYLFHHLAIKAGKKTYTFIEVEFYYYNKNGIFQGPLYSCTYPRSRDAGQFFWHLSGMDICFESKEKEGYFGGILIRSLKKNDEEIIAGPMRCSYEILNSCKTELPTLVEHESNSGYEPKTTFRYGIEADKNQGKSPMQFRYYIPQDKWTRTRNSVLVEDKSTGGYKTIKKTDYYPAQPK